MKRLLSLIFCAAIQLSFPIMPLRTSAATSGYYTYTVSNSEATITDCDTSISGDITIPATLGGYPVTAIGYYAFRSCDSLTSITIPGSVTSIGNDAFLGCSCLVRFVVEEGSQHYSTDAYGVLFNKDKTTLVCAPGAMFGSYTIPDGVISIGDSAFAYCGSLTSVTIPNGVTSIDTNAFYECTSLTSVTIPDSVTNVGDLFYNCHSLNYNIYDNGNYLGNAKNPYVAFISPIRDSISTCNIHADTKIIVDNAFIRCKSLTSITIPNSVTSIGHSAFRECHSLTSVTISDSVTTIGGDAFYMCESLNSVTIPHSVTSIGSTAFQSCSSLVRFVVEEGSQHYSTDAYGVLFNKEKTTLLCAPGAMSGSYTIPDSVTSIGDYAFYGFDSLTSITIPNGVTTIGAYAFCGCSSLTNITIPNSVTTIGQSVFMRCTSLTSVAIPNSVTTISREVFDTCTSLTNITIPNSVTTIGKYAFYRCTSLTNIAIPDSVTTIEPVAFFGCTSLTTATIPNSITSIPNRTFHNCSKLTSVTIPDSIISIEESAFDGCDNLTWIYYAGSKTQWRAVNIGSGNDGLENATIHYGKTDPSDYLTYTVSNGEATIIGGDKSISGDITIPATLGGYPVTSIGLAAFQLYYPRLTSVTIPDSVTTIGECAFAECDNLTNVILGNSVRTIDSHAFAKNLNMVSITISDSVTNIGEAAFDDCSLTNVYYAGSKAQWEEISIGEDNEELTNATIHYNHVHDYTFVDPVVVQYCDQAGYTEYTCVYGETHRVTLPALGHLQETEGVVTEPTCTEQGYTSYICGRCSETVKTDMVAALGHDCTIPLGTFAPSCEEDGYTGMKCSRCEYVQKTDIVYALGHNMVVLPAVAPTCTETGLTKGSGCDRCGLVGIAQKEVAATGHNYVDGICTNCGVDSVLIKTMPGKVYYFAGEELDLSGLVLLAVRKNGAIETVTDGYSVSGFDSETLGSKEITVTYEGVSATFTVIVIDANTKVIDENGNPYSDFADAIAAGSKLTLMADIAEDVVIDKDIVLDLNGHSITGTITVSDGCTLYGMDSQTDDYTVEDDFGYGKLTDVVGNVVGLPEESDSAQDGYLMITEDDGISFHRVNLQISAMSLRASAAGVYFKSDFAADEVVAPLVKSFGVALSIKGMPNASNLSSCQYSTFKNFTAGENKDATSTLLKGIMKEGNAYLINKANANTDVYGRAYIQLADGSYIFGAGVQRSLRQQVEAIDAMWASLSADQQASVLEMYNTYTSVMKSWEIPNIIAAA